MGSQINSKIQVPFQSQNSVDVPEEWHDSVCGIACVKMIIDFMGERFDMENLINEGLEHGGYLENIGWIHSVLVKILHNHGVLAYSEDFKSENEKFSKEFFERGIEKIINSLENNKPVIVSVEPNFTNNKNSSHLILLVGISDNSLGKTRDRGFYYHDPDTRDGKIREGDFVDLEKFKKFWRKLAIFVN